MLAKSLKETIFEYILNSKLISTKKLVSHFVTKKICTKQGVYKILRELKHEEKVIWITQTVQPNLIWLQKTIDTLSEYLPNKQLYQEALPKDKQKLIFKLKTLNEVDTLYGQLFVTILSSLEPDERDFLFYDLHNYTYLDKVPLVDWYINYIFKKKAKAYLLVGSISPLDSTLKKKMKTVQVHCVSQKYFNQFICTLGDYVIYNYIDKKVLSQMDTIFNTETEITAREFIKTLSEQKGSFKIVVEKSKEKTLTIRKIFKKYFDIK